MNTTVPPQLMARLGGMKTTMNEIQSESPPIVVPAVASSDVEAVVTSDIPQPTNISDMRIFRSNPAGSRFQFSSGKEIYFNHGWYETNDPKEIAELDSVVSSGKGCIYTDERQDKIMQAVNDARRNLGLENHKTDVAQILNQVVALGESLLPGQQSAVGTIPVISAPVQAGVDPEQSLRAAILQAGREVAGSGN